MTRSTPYLLIGSYGGGVRLFFFFKIDEGRRDHEEVFFTTSHHITSQCNHFFSPSPLFLCARTFYPPLVLVAARAFFSFS
jgi:hypothetical protein